MLCSIQPRLSRTQAIHVASLPVQGTDQAINYDMNDVDKTRYTYRLFLPTHFRNNSIIDALLVDDHNEQIVVLRGCTRTGILTISYRFLHCWLS